MEIRKATPQDIPKIQGLLDKGIREKTLQPRRGGELRRNIGGFMVAEDKGSIVGMASVVIYDRRLAEIRSVYVEQDYRGNGLGRELVQKVQEKTVEELPSSTIFAITTTPKLFEPDGFASMHFEEGMKRQRYIIFKRI